MLLAIRQNIFDIAFSYFVTFKTKYRNEIELGALPPNPQSLSLKGCLAGETFIENCHNKRGETFVSPAGIAFARAFGVLYSIALFFEGNNDIISRGDKKTIPTSNIGSSVLYKKEMEKTDTKQKGIEKYFYIKLVYFVMILSTIQNEFEATSCHSVNYEFIHLYEEPLFYPIIT